MKVAAVEGIGKIIEARREQLRFRLLLALVITAAFHPITGLLPALTWCAAYSLLQVVEYHLLSRPAAEGEADPSARIWAGISGVFISNLGLAAFGLLEILHSGVWGIVCAVMLWIGIITYGAVVSAGSKHAAAAATAPPAACFLLVPLFAIANGAPALYGWLAVLGAMLSIASTLTVLGLSKALFQ